MSDVKQQIVDKLKDSGSILVTVNANPTVDELSATLGLTMLLNKMNKHATAVFSGNIPPAIEFLDPAKTFESTVDSLRDFIIALDKEKADHLRYKVVDDMVKIYITPYRTTITEQDLEFSQGDYNVEMVIAIGVRDARDLDKALESHGKILEDATVVALSCGAEVASLGGVDWHEPKLGSYCEMVMLMIEALKSDKKLIDEQIATALLTGLVAATERFSNDKTSSRVMTIAAELMSQGANQQLIVTKLHEASTLEPSPTAEPSPSSKISSKKASKPDAQASQSTPDRPTQNDSTPTTSDDSDSGALSISHQPTGSLEQVEAAVRASHQAEATEVAVDKLDEAKKAREEQEQAQAAAKAEAELIKHVDRVKQDTPAPEPDFGGTLNATAEKAAEEARKARESEKNHKILTHNDAPEHGGYIATTPNFQSPLNSTMGDLELPSTSDSQAAPPSTDTTAPTARADDIAPPIGSETLADIDAKHRDARSDIEAALQEADGQMLVSHTASLAPSSEPLSVVATPAATVATPPLPPLPPLPPMPDFSTLPPLPPLTQPPVVAGAPTPTAEPASTAKDPAQFRIPGQT